MYIHLFPIVAVELQNVLLRSCSADGNLTCGYISATVVENGGSLHNCETCVDDFCNGGVGGVEGCGVRGETTLLAGLAIVGLMTLYL